jgi:cyclopropane-fatty-acyl-phospholipid synthase
LSSKDSAAAAVTEVLEKTDVRQLPFSVRFWDGSEIAAASEQASFTVLVNSPDAVAHLLREPNQLGLGRAWVLGELDVDGDIDEVFSLGRRFAEVRLGWGARLAALARAWRLGALARAFRPSVPDSEARVRGRAHSLRRDRRAIAHHYDVSNDFYRLVLGPSMVYSCAYFSAADESLEDAQERKLDLICRKLALSPGERLLDIGCGWGSLVLHAAAYFGVRAVGVTISKRQAGLGRARIREAGLSDRCEIRLADYREVDDGPYDKVASIGMYEHVGRAQLDRYVAAVSALLRPGGLFLNHGIARLRPAPRSSKSFIARYVFPDGELHPLDALATSLRRAGMELRDVESLREHYPLTLRRWSANLAARREEAIAAAGSERERVWRLYMAGAASAFERGEITVFQTLAADPGRPSGLPLDRADIGRRVGAGGGSRTAAGQGRA